MAQCDAAMTGEQTESQRGQHGGELESVGQSDQQDHGDGKGQRGVLPTGAQSAQQGGHHHTEQGTQHG